jgi:hypothetical protein
MVVTTYLALHTHLLSHCGAVGGAPYQGDVLAHLHRRRLGV